MQPSQDLTVMQNVMTVGQRALTAFQNWAATGDWQPFLNYLSDDVNIAFAAPEPYGGTKYGKAEVEKILRTFSEDLQLRVEHTAKTPMVNATSFSVEFTAKGTASGRVVERQLLVVFDISDDKVTAIREYAVP